MSSPSPATPDATRKLTQLAIDDGIARLSLDDGKVNALSAAMIAEIDDGLGAAEAAEAIVVVRGRPGIFSAGFDLKTFARGAGEGAGMVAAGARLVLRILRHPQPVFTVCTGHAYPAGAFLMLAADSRTGIDGPFQIGMNEVAIGLTLPRFAAELARHRLSPPGFVRVLTASMFAPPEARAVGYLDRVVSPEELDASVETEIDRLRGLDLPSFRETKARINGPAIDAIGAALERELGSLSS